MNKKKVLVTGATGFLGRHLVRRLLELNCEVTILVRPSSHLEPFADLELKKAYGDITDTLALLQACEGKDIVYHLAGFIAYKRTDRKAMEKINVQGTRNVVDACITNKVGALVHLSSVVTIGASRGPKALDENAEYNLAKFNLGYFETKRSAEKIIVEAHEEHNLNAFLINPSTIYGAGDATKGSRKTQIKVAKGKFKLYPPGGVNVVYVKDVIDAIIAVTERGKPARRYIVCGDNLTIKELFRIIADEAGVKPPSIPIPKLFIKILGKIGDLMTAFGKETSLSSETAVTSTLYHWFDGSRAQRELQLKPTPSRVAIAESISWMKEKGLLDS
ncbi:MAG: NAD-dependent epimerase/dehydratase family protein [Bdellovibrionales bacterium]|nr:NAD-dependent epimerase/dehydratase family protein [Bdellovibrionales bacterium]